MLFLFAAKMVSKFTGLVISDFKTEITRESELFQNNSQRQLNLHKFEQEIQYVIFLNVSAVPYT